MAFVFVVINQVVSLGRAHTGYNPTENSVGDRFAILADAGKASVNTNSRYLTVTDSGNVAVNLKEMTSSLGRMKALGTRLDVASIQGYLINEYDNGRPGNSLADFWAVFIPRVFWPGKPVITRFGTELNAQYYFVPGTATQNTSSIGPTYSAEAYWNYGLPGVLIVSILMGLVIGWFTRCWQSATVGADPAFFLVAFPVAIWASFVESWVVATYFGEFIIFVVILLLARAFIALYGPLSNRVLS